MRTRKNQDRDDPIGEWDSWQKNRYIEGYAADKVQQEGQLLPKYTATPKVSYTPLNVLCTVSFVVLMALALYCYSRHYLLFVMALLLSITSGSILLYRVVLIRKRPKRLS